MSVVREAVALPLLFLTVVLLGAIRIADPLQVVPPSLFSLILASLLFAAFVQSGTLAADRLLNARRSPLENASGTIVCVTVFVATAQIIGAVTPASGLPSVMFGLFFLVGLVLILAASLDRIRLLRVLAALLGSAFALQFVVLAAISAPAEGRVTRALQLLFEGATLGTVAQADIGSATGYLVFVALVLYLIGIWLLPSAGWIVVRTLATPIARVAPPTPASSPDDVVELPD